ncbi:MAG: tetratricopeptide repeat protein [Betaproteobacteria bacterium]|nr:MAG: tetratricopeptide repeat protein [Betaproteobacteria bacterium]
MNRPATPLTTLLFALALAASPAYADDLQDIDRLVKGGQHAQALERVNRYLAQNPSDAQGRFKKGLILAEQNKVAEAIEVFTKLSQDYPKLPEPHNNLAVLYASQGQYEKARQQLEMSIRTDPRFATAYENLGDVYTKLASQAYDKALQLDSSNSVAKNKLSLIRDLLMTSEPRLPAVSSAPAGKTAEPARPPVVAAGPKKSDTEAKPAPGQAKPAAAKPAEQPAPARGGNTEEVLQAVRAWAGAWSKQDLDAYLAFYAKDFKTPKGETRAQWEAARKQRISTPKKIEVAVESPKVTLKGDSAVVTFRQAYRSDNLKIKGSKTLHMVRGDGRWLIQEERSGG